MGIDRRSFIRNSAGLILGQQLLGNQLQANEVAEAKTSMASYPTLSGQLDCDVVVIGAGFAGVSAAARLHQAGKKVVLLEARDRLGGRTHTIKSYDDAILDVGGIWVGPTQPRVIQLAKDHGIKLFATYNQGNNVLDNQGEISHYAGTIPKLNPLGLADFALTQNKLEALAQKVDLQAPWQTPDAYQLDNQTLAYWIEKQTWSSTARKLFIGAFEQIFSADTRRLSLLHALYVIKAAGGMGPLFDTEGGAQQYRFHAGTVSLLEAMVAPFKSKISLSTPVRAILQNEQGVEVVSEKLRLKARRVIVAIPPTLAGRIDYSPLLSADRDHLTQSVPMGSVIKFFAFYQDNFWRKQNLSGQIVSLEGPIFSTFDNSIPGRQTGILVGFLVGTHAERFRRLSRIERKQGILKHLTLLFGPQAQAPAHYEEHDWTMERWSRGCFLGYLPPGIWTGLGHALWQPEGRIHFAGTETARQWNGYIEGAIESGHRAADEIIPLI